MEPRNRETDYLEAFMNKTTIYGLFLIAGITGLVSTADSAYLRLENMPENYIDLGKSIYYTYHANTTSEGLDTVDGLWENAPPAQFPFWLRLSSNPWGKLLKVDARPDNSI